MINEKLLDVFGEESRDMLNSMCNAIGAEAAAECYVAGSNGAITLNGVKMPHMIRVPANRAKDIRERLDKFLDDNGYTTRKIHLTDNKRDDDIQLSIPDAGKSCKYTVNPVFVNLYGEGGIPVLQEFINKLGEQVAPTVKVVGKCGCKLVNGVKMPNMISTESAQCNYVEHCVKEFYEQWGGEAVNETIEVTTEMMVEGDIPLCSLNECVRRTSAFDFAARMMGS